MQVPLLDEALQQYRATAFANLSELFTVPKTQPLEIEILPKGCTGLVRDGCCVGVPKSILLAAMCHVLLSEGLPQTMDLNRLVCYTTDCTV